jgi:hypothetical protein
VCVILAGQAPADKPDEVSRPGLISPGRGTRRSVLPELDRPWQTSQTKCVILVEQDLGEEPDEVCHPSRTGPGRGARRIVSPQPEKSWQKIQTMCVPQQRHGRQVSLGVVMTIHLRE